MTRNNFTEDETEIEVEHVVRKEKKKKTKEERSRDRRAVFLVLFFLLMATFLFWLKAVLVDGKKILKNPDDFVVEEGEKTKNDEVDVFYVKYKI